MKNEFKFCPMCKSSNIVNHPKKWYCKDCDFELYMNIASAVGIIIKDTKNNVLFEVRSKEPKKGYLCLPGGFVDKEEKAEEAIIRECMEEIGIKIDDVKYLCSNPNTYPYKNFEYKTCDVFFYANIPNKYLDMSDFIKDLKAQKSEVEDFVFYKVTCLEDIEKIPLAFQSAKQTLIEFVLMNNK